ncbi:MAG: sulfur carrier protein ThiS [Acidimicrobiales bacterium]
MKAVPNGVTLTVNGDPLSVAPGSTIADVVTVVAEGTVPKGIAVAVDRCVIPRSEWHRTVARSGSLIEVVTAAAGG